MTKRNIGDLVNVKYGSEPIDLFIITSVYIRPVLDVHTRELF